MEKSNIEREFSCLGRSKKSEFIGKYIDLAPASAIADYVKAYLFDVLNDVDDEDYIATFLRGHGWKCESPNQKK